MPQTENMVYLVGPSILFRNGNFHIHPEDRELSLFEVGLSPLVCSSLSAAGIERLGQLHGLAGHELRTAANLSLTNYLGLLSMLRASLASGEGTRPAAVSGKSVTPLTLLNRLGVQFWPGWERTLWPAFRTFLKSEAFPMRYQTAFELFLSFVRLDPEFAAFRFSLNRRLSEATVTLSQYLEGSALDVESETFGQEVDALTLLVRAIREVRLKEGSLSLMESSGTELDDCFSSIVDYHWAAHYPVRDVLECYPLSARLAKCLSGMSEFPIKTIGEYAELGVGAQDFLINSLRRLGASLASELDVAIRNFVSGGVSDSGRGRPGMDLCGDDVLAAFLSLSFSTLLRKLCVDDDLQSVVTAADPEYGFVPFRASVDYFQDIDEAYGKTLLFGKSTAKRLRDELEKYCPRSDVFRDLVAEIREKEFEWHPRVQISTADLIRQLMVPLNPRYRDILVRRYGFEGFLDQSLEEIASHLGIGSQRVRQLEDEALEILSSHSKALRSALHVDREIIWLSLGAKYGAIRKRRFDFREFLEHFLPGEIELAFQVVYGGGSQDFFDFLQCKENPHAWYRTDTGDRDLTASITKLVEGWGLGCLPAQVSLVGSFLNLSIEAVGLAAIVSGEYDVVEEYLFPQRMSVRPLRGLRLHRILSERQPVTASLDELVGEYARRYRSPVCNERDALAAMASYPHLFVELGEIGWLALGNASQQYLCPEGELEEESSPESMGDEGQDADDAVEDGDSTVADILGTILCGEPLSLAQISEKFAAISDGRYRTSSVAPVLSTDPKICRIAPNFYALNEQLGEVIDESRELPGLQDVTSCRYYVLARYAGHSHGYYPAWTLANERRWCYWAMENADLGDEQRILFESLLAVIEPEFWSTGDRDFWMDQKELRGKYHLLQPLQLGDALPEPYDLLKCLAYLRTVECISWISINRVLKRSFNSARSSVILALLIGLRAVYPAENWQRPHARRLGEHPLFQTLADAQASSSRPLSWADGRVGVVLETVLEGLEKTWVPEEAMKNLIENFVRAKFSPVDREEKVCEHDDIFSMLDGQVLLAEVDSIRGTKDNLNQWASL